MIKVYDDYIILVDDMSYTAAIDTHKTQTDKKSGEEKPVYNRIGYYSTIKGALKGIAKHDVNSKLETEEFSISETLRKINEASDRIEEILKEVRA